MAALDPFHLLHPFDQRVRLHVYRTLIDTVRAPSVEETAAALEAEPDEVAGAYRRLAEGRALVLAPGTLNVWMANPLSAVPTPFPVQVGGRRHFGNCIWDALGVVAMLAGPDGDGRVGTWCPDCGEPLAFEVRGGGVARADGIAHFAVPAARWWDNIGFN